MAHQEVQLHAVFWNQFGGQLCCFQTEANAVTKLGQATHKVFAFEGPVQAGVVVFAHLPQVVRSVKLNSDGVQQFAAFLCPSVQPTVMLKRLMQLATCPHTLLWWQEISRVVRDRVVKLNKALEARRPVHVMERVRAIALNNSCHNLKQLASLGCFA